MVTLSVVVPSILAVGVLLALSAFFSSSESAIFSLSDEWIQATATDGSPASRTLEALRRDPHRLLVTVLVGNNLVNIALTSVITLLVAEVLPPGPSIVVVTLGVSVLIVVFGEILPKSYGLGHAEAWSLRVARPVSLVERALGPVVVVFDVTTRWLSELLGGNQHIERPYIEE